jgi:hypothetical protein
MRARRRITAAVAAAGLAVTLALAGCSGDSSKDQSSSSGSAPNLAEPAPAEAPAMGAPEAAGAGQDKAAEAPNLSVDQRSIIYTGAITVRVEDVSIAAARATGIATAAGGFVGGDKRSSGSGSQDATLELRVPGEKFSPVVEQLAGLGNEEQRGINTEDVTEQTIDLDARIATQQARVDSGRKLLAQAKSLSDLVMLEREVATREADLASLQAKKRRLADLTALSTITLILLDPAAVAAQAQDGPPGFLAGLENGWKGLLASLAVLLTLLGWLLPWLIAIGLPAWGIIWLYRRYRPRRPARTPMSVVPAYAMAGPPPGYPQAAGTAPAHPARHQPQAPHTTPGMAAAPGVSPAPAAASAAGMGAAPVTGAAPGIAKPADVASKPGDAPQQQPTPPPGRTPPKGEETSGG